MRTSILVPRAMHLALALVAALWVPASAQTTPSSYFTVTKVPQITRQLLTADFNGDGRLDLIANATGEGEPPLLVLTLGRGDGTFPAPQALGAAEPLAVADFNGDGRRDLLVKAAGNYSVLPGNGNGTFGAPRLIQAGPAASSALAIAGRFTDGDTVPDVVVPGVDAAGNAILRLYPGNGDFTFGVPFPQPVPDGGYSQLRAVNLDSDGLSDIVATNVCCSVFMLRNTGTNSFETRSVPIASDIGEVHAADLNGDGVVDVVAAQSLPDFIGSGPGIAVLWGGFSATSYELFDAGVSGEYALALADFTGDGQMDIASGNWSQYRDDDVGPQLWSSVSVLKGRITNATTRSMTFEAPVTFALGTVNGEGYISSYSLAAGDFNSDGRPDLAHAPGAILLNRPPVPNRPPTVFLGPDRTINQDAAQGFLVSAEASDPDGHWLTYSWTSSWNSSPRPSPTIMVFLGFDPGPVTLEVTVRDGHGGEARDSVTFTVADSYIQVVSLASPTVLQVGQPYTVRWFPTDIEGELHGFNVSYSTNAGRTFTPIPGCVNLPGSATSCTWQNPGPASARAMLRIEASYGDGKRWVDVSREFRLTAAPPPLPAGWRSRDIGAVGAAGSAVETFGGILVSGSGADIWGTADELHFASTTMTGDFAIEARVQSLEPVDPWTKAGLMIRSGLGAGAAHASILVTPSTTKGLSLQFRAQDGGASTEQNRVTSVTTPVWLRLRREGTNVQASYHRGSGNWIDLPAVTVALGAAVEVGLAVSSHVDGTIAEAFFDELAIRAADLPPSVNRADVGAVGAPGTSVYANGVYTIEGSGADIWGTADEFHWAYTNATGDFEFSGRVVSIEQLDAWVKAGLMIRESSAPGSRHVSLFATPTTSKGLAFQRRLAFGGLSTHTSGPRLAPSVWLRLTRSGNVITASYRTAGSGPWTLIGTETVSLLQATVQVGLAVSSHRDGMLATAVFDNVTLTSSAFASADVGVVGLAGSTSVGTAGVTLNGAGADIWGTADAFRYYYRAWSSEGTLSARVASVEPTHRWAKAGVMMRESRAAGSPHVMIVVSAERGVAMQYRATAGGASANVAVVPGAAPRWVRLGRLGNQFIGEVSGDGVTWTEVGRVTVTMADASLAGLVVTSHDRAALATVSFDNIVVGAGAP